ncbi:MAG TPA: GDSL-type esterase/lipase family protein [Candidatus Acidoferrales bacterium]|nr:GDSL-type esterase/lipase family protein [Candidatus Acidoferrales bacterium]
MTAGDQHPTRKLFYLVILLTPILFFVLLEVALRIFNYGYSYPMWVNPVEGELKLNGYDYTTEVTPVKKVFTLNPDIASKYFHDVQNIPRSDGDVFEEMKMPNAFRIFVLGESAAAGYPFIPNGSFSRYLEQRLSLEYPDSKIEVVDCGISAINSYTLRDFMFGILEENPDLIIIYAGNNEYYGALGVGSMESFGTSPSIVNLVIYLEQFRTFQLLRNAIKGLTGIFEKKQLPTATLMSYMARDQYIALGSKVYEEGIAQFKGNMTDILDMAKRQNVPVILGTLACNLKDQYPFVSISEDGLPRADTVFMQAKRELAKGDYHTADSLFRYAKDLDALRFRAPTAINKVICKLGNEFNCPVVNVDSAFEAISPDNIVGDNLMTDHLHPTLRGYQIIGSLFYSEMEKAKLLPKTKPLGLIDQQQDSITVANFPFSRLDSVISDYRIKDLKNDWPYVSESKRIPSCKLFAPKDYIDSLAYSVVMDRIGWETAHKDASLWYYSRGDMDSFVRIMNVLITQFPYTPVNYDFAISMLLKAKDYDGAYYFLTKRNQLQANAYCEKWLGIIDLVENRVDSAKGHLAASLNYNDGDAQVWYYLAEAYVGEKDYQMALQAIERALQLQSNFPVAAELEKQLRATVGEK